MEQPASIDELQSFVRRQSHVRVRGGGTKSALSQDANLCMLGYSGIVNYDPSEYTFTAKAGTPLRDVVNLLQQSGQYLPFDPVWVDAGATLGGTIASGLSGPGRFRFGGVRDFILGAEFITGDGELRSGGGKVVKNAAGFDFPKLLVGSRGTMGVITEATFKVFPKPSSYVTLKVPVAGPRDAVALLKRLGGSSLELAALDYAPPAVELRLGGLSVSLPTRVERTRELLASEVEEITGDEELHRWRDAREFAWQPAGCTLVKIPIQAGDIQPIEEFLLRCPEAARRYSSGGHVCWLAWPTVRGPAALLPILSQIRRNGLAVSGEPWGLLGPTRDAEFHRRLAQVMDPFGKLRLQSAASAPTA